MSKEPIPIPDILTADVEIRLSKKELKDSSQVFYLDREVFIMAIGIQNTLNKHAPTKGDSWKEMTPGECTDRIHEELIELRDALLDEAPEVEIAGEAMDIALFALFCWYLHTTYIGIKP